MSMEENISILVVDDEDRIRRLLNMYLTREGYIVDEAVDGAGGLLGDLLAGDDHGIDVRTDLALAAQIGTAAQGGASADSRPRRRPRSSCPTAA